MNILNTILFALCAGIYLANVGLSLSKYSIDWGTWEPGLSARVWSPDWIGVAVNLFAFLCWTSGAGIWLWRAVQAAGQGVSW